MFLPVLLIRDFGWAGFAAFALPNCVGAAAMGWVLWREGSSEGFVRSHGTMVRLFSLITFLFHVVWLTQVAVPLAGVGRVRELAIVLTLLTFGFLFSTGVKSAVATYAVSLAALVVWLVRGGVEPGPEAGMYAAGRLPAEHIAGLIPVCVFGFALCPYLDGTFHKARRAVDARGAKVAFGVGFLVFFALMIVFTAMYAPVFGRSHPGGATGVSRTAVAWVVAHMMVQATFTMGVHLRVLLEGEGGLRKGEYDGDVFARLVRRGKALESGEPRHVVTARAVGGKKRASAWAVLAIGALFVAVMRMAMSTQRDKAPPPVWDAGGDGLAWYRVFMGAYGLVFPAYVWICCVGTGNWALGGGAWRKPSIEQVKVWVLACVIASPLMYMGFVERRTLLLLPAMGLVFAARWMVRKPAGPSASGHHAIG
jgi:hypothetical protein